MDTGPLLRHFAAQFDLPPGIVTQAGSSVRPEPDRDWTVLWPLGSHTLIRAPESEAEGLRALIQPGKLLSVDQIAPVWGSVMREDVHLYVFDAESFHAALPPKGFHVRQLNPMDGPAFERFKASIPPEAQEEGDVDLSHEAIFGVLHGDEILSAASSYELLGGIDIGVLTQQEQRGLGLGKAAVSALILHHKGDARPILYRMSDTNHASRRLAESLGLVYLLTMRGIRRF